MKSKATLTITMAALLTLASTAPALAGWRHHHARVHVRIVVGPRQPIHRVVLVNGHPAASIDFNVKPKATKIFIDGAYRGTCAEYDGFPEKMYLKPGKHVIRLVTPDGESIKRTIHLVAGFEVNLNLEL